MSSRGSPLASVVLLGWVIATSQTILLREALAAAQGNELAIALALGQWLVLTAAGSAAAGLLPSRSSRRSFLAGALLLGPALFASLLTARGLPRIFSLAPGALLTLDQHVLGLSFTLAPVCLVGGASFTLACRLPGVAPTRAYLAEAAGWFAGGVTATWLVETWQPFAVAAGLSVAAVLAATLLARRSWILAAIGVAVAAVLGQHGLAAIETRSLAWRWPGETIEASAYTRHGHVAVLLRAEQRALYEDGHLALVLPERQSSEELVHLALLQVREPRRIFVARGMGGLLPEILKYPVVEVALAEPEASLAAMEIKAADPATRQALRDGRVHVLTGDVRNLLRRGGDWDVVLLSTAEPSTLLASRLLTRESFAEARRALRPGGVLAFALPGAENYYSPELVARNGAVYKALASVFAHVVVTPLSTNYFLASDSPLSRDPVELAQRLQQRKITANFVDEYSLAVLMPEERVQSLSNRYSEAAVAASSDRLPTAYLHDLQVSGRENPGRVSDLLRWALSLGFWPLGLGLAVLLVVPALLAARGRKAQGPALLVVSVAGFASMASAVLILAVTQSALGALRHLLGALLAANMAGLALAAWTGSDGGTRKGRVVDGEPAAFVSAPLPGGERPTTSASAGEGPAASSGPRAPNGLNVGWNRELARVWVFRLAPRKQGRRAKRGGRGARPRERAHLPLSLALSPLSRGEGIGQCPGVATPGFHGSVKPFGALELRSFLACRPPLPALSPSGRGFRKRTDVVSSNGRQQRPVPRLSPKGEGAAKPRGVEAGVLVPKCPGLRGRRRPRRRVRVRLPT